jgi:hypothetical protein
MRLTNFIDQQFKTEHARDRAFVHVLMHLSDRMPKMRTLREANPHAVEWTDSSEDKLRNGDLVIQIAETYTPSLEDSYGIRIDVSVGLSSGHQSVDFPIAAQRFEPAWQKIAIALATIERHIGIQ